MISRVKANYFLSVLLVVGFCFLFCFVVQAIKRIPYPFSISSGEDYIMTYAKLWTNGQWKWDVTVPPFLTMIYGVGFPILAQPFVNLFGAELWVGRSISFVSSLVVCFLIYKIVKLLTNRKGYALLAALLPFTQPIFRDWAMMARVDMAAVMFDVLGFYLVIKFKDTRHIYWAVIPFICAIMTKLLDVTGLLAVIIYLVIYNRKKAVAFLSVLGIGLVLTLVPLWIISHGTYLQHVITYNNNIEFINLATFSFLFGRFILPFVVLGILSIIYICKCQEIRDWALPCLFCIVALAVDIGTSMRSGADSLYYLEAIVSASICSALALSYLLDELKDKAFLGIVNVGVICLLVAFSFFSGLFSNFSLPDKKYTEAAYKVIAIMSDSPKPVITENPTLTVASGRDLQVELYIFTNMARLGVWDETLYIKEYQSQSFDYVVLSIPLEDRVISMDGGLKDGYFTDAVLRAIDQNYSLIYKTDSLSWPYAMFVYEANDKLK